MIIVNGFQLSFGNYYHKALHLACCSSPRTASDIDQKHKRMNKLHEQIMKQTENQFILCIFLILKIHSSFHQFVDFENSWYLHNICMSWFSWFLQQENSSHVTNSSGIVPVTSLILRSNINHSIWCAPKCILNWLYLFLMHSTKNDTCAGDSGIRTLSFMIIKCIIGLNENSMLA